MRLGVFDPGASTGVAIFVLERLSSLMVTSRLERSFTTASLDELREVLRSVDEVVAEQGPERRQQPEACEPVESLIKSEADDVHWVRPTEWKPHPQGHLQPADMPDTVHAADAIRLGRYFIGIRSRELVHI